MNTYTYPYPEVLPDEKKAFGLFVESQVANDLGFILDKAFNNVTIDHLSAARDAPNYDRDARFCDIKLRESSQTKVYFEVKTVGSTDPEAAWSFNALFPEGDRSNVSALLQEQWPLLRVATKQNNAVYVILMFIIPKAERRWITNLYQAGLYLDHPSMVEAMKRCKILAFYGSGDKAGARVYDNYEHFTTWLKCHPNAVDSFTFALNHYESYCGDEPRQFQRVTEGDSYLDTIVELNKRGCDDKSIALHLNGMGAYLCGYNRLSSLNREYLERFIDQQILESYLLTGAWSAALVSHLRDRLKCDLSLMSLKFSYEDLVSLDLLLRNNTNRRAPQRRGDLEFVNKLELKAFNQWAKVVLLEVNTGQRSFKRHPAFETAEAVCYFINQHSQGEVIKVALDSSRRLLGRLEAWKRLRGNS